MRYSPIQLRSVSLFILLFLCLNAFGILCLSVCSTGEGDAALSVPSCHQKPANGSDIGSSKIADSADGAECCAMPVVFVAASFEKRVSAIEVPFGIASVRVTFKSPAEPFQSIAHASTYRPPLADHSIDRIKYGVIRI